MYNLCCLQEFDWLWFVGGNVDGFHVQLGVCRRKDRVADVWLTLHHPDAGSVQYTNLTMIAAIHVLLPSCTCTVV